MGISQIDVNLTGAQSPYVVIIDRQGEVIGGCLIYVREGKSTFLLPLESDAFKLHHVLSGLVKSDTLICEYSRLAIRKEHRSHILLEKLIRFKFAFCKYIGVDYLFVNAPLIQSRSYKQISRSLGFDYTVLLKVPMPVKEVYGRLNKVVLSAMPFNEEEVILESMMLENGLTHGTTNTQSSFKESASS